MIRCGSTWHPWIAVVLLLGMASCAIGATWYVRPQDDPPRPNPTGASWGSAYSTIDEALVVADSGDEIWVTEGTYTSQSGTIDVPAGVMLFGGFSGDESTRDERNWDAHQTVLSGWYISAAGGAQEPAAIDGFTITQCYVMDFSGDVTFSHNVVTESILGIDDVLIFCEGPVKLVNNLIHNNHPDKGEGTCTIECYPNQGEPIIVNNTISWNGDPQLDGAALLCGSGALVANNIIHYSGAYGIVNASYTTLTVYNCCVTGHMFADYSPDYMITPQSCTSLSPLFVGGSPFDPRLQAGSPCLDTGDDGQIGYSAIPEFAKLLDLDHRPRIQGPHVDMGAYEYPDTTPPVVTITAPPAGELHQRSGASITISGTATDGETGSGVASVEVRVDSTALAGVSYDGATQTWTCEWPNPSSGNVTISVNATDGAGNTCADMTRDVVVTPVDVVHVRSTGSDSADGSTWATAKKTVQEAITAASAGDEVWVAAGTYPESITLKEGVKVYGGFAGTPTETVREQRDWVTNETTLTGSSAISSRILAGAGITRVTMPDGFTVTGYVGSDAEPGAIRCKDSSPVVSHNRIKDNVARGVVCELSDPAPAPCAPLIEHNTISGNGGAGVWSSAASPRVQYNTITDNQAWGVHCSDGAVVVECNTVSGNEVGVLTDGCDAEIVGNTICDNADGSSPCGAGIICTYGSASIRSNTIAGNEADIVYGGGITCDQVEAVEIDGNRVLDNGRDLCLAGGGIWLNLCGPALVTNNVVARNRCTGGDDGHGGGGLAVWETPCDIIHNTFVGNAVRDPLNFYLSGHGGAVEVRDASSGGPPVRIINCIFHENYADLGDSISAVESASVEITNCLFFNIDDPLQDHHFYCDGTSSLVYDATARFIDPLMCDVTSLLDPGLLRSDSPAIGAGVSTNRSVDHDIEGNPRPGLGGYDIGAHEDNPGCSP